MAARRKRFPPSNVTANRKPCIDCISEGITTKRKAPHPGPRCTTHHRVKKSAAKNYSHSNHIWERYGITSDEYWEVYEHQESRCYICRRATGAKRKLSVDHCHSTGTVRGLLCQPCNRMLGHARDDAEVFYRAADYLAEPPAVQVLGIRITPDCR